jgi:Zn-dependent protease
MDGWREIPCIEAGRIGGVPVRFDAVYPVMVLAIALSMIGRNAPSLSALAIFTLIAIAGATLSILLHELGHVAMARRFHLRAEEIRIGGFYGLAVLEDAPRSRLQRIAVLAAGPAVNAALFVLFWMLLGMPGLNSRLYFDYGPDMFQTLAQQNWLTSTSLRWLAFLNLGMAVFNLIPAFPLDGGRIWRLALAGKVRDEKLVRAIAWTGIVIGVWSFFGTVAYPGMLAAGILLIIANYGIAKGEISPPD